ncbi:MAG TPA: hypothetical protein VGE39_12830 [Prosthecobacter sp.]
MTSRAGDPHPIRPAVRRPLAATLVGWAFILMGSYYGMVMLAAWLQGRCSVDVSVVMVPVGMGLLKGSSSSQSWARFIAGLWIAMGSTDLLCLGIDLWHAEPYFFEDATQGWPFYILTLTNCLLAIAIGMVVWRALSDRAYIAPLVAGEGQASGPHSSAR